MLPILAPIIGKLGGELIDNLFETEEEKAAAKAKLERIDIQRYETQLSAIIAEAKSADPWTSRARPSFLYVMYVMILTAIPMGFLFAFYPEVADAVIVGVKGWLQAIPEPMWALFGAGYLGYTAGRSYDKRQAKNGKK